MDIVSRGALPVAKLVWQPGHGGFAITVVCKATFELRPELSPLASAQDPIVERDVYAASTMGLRPAEPGSAPYPGQSLARPSELVPWKQASEVLVTGSYFCQRPEGTTDDPDCSVAGTVTFGTVPATPTTWQDTAITVEVPLGITGSEAVSVTSGGKTSNSVGFTAQ